MHKRIKTILCLFVGLGSLSQLCSAASVSPDIVEKRTFFNTDRTKSFDGELYEYFEFKKAVRISINGKVKTMKLDVLSKEDQEYVKKNAPLVAVSRGLKMEFKEATSKAVERGTLSIREFNYNINIRNRAGTTIEGLTVDYHTYYYIGDVNKAGSVLARKSGSENLDVYAKMSNYLSTDKLELVKNVVKGKSGG